MRRDWVFVAVAVLAMSGWARRSEACSPPWPEDCVRMAFPPDRSVIPGNVPFFSVRGARDIEADPTISSEEQAAQLPDGVPSVSGRRVLIDGLPEGSGVWLTVGTSCDRLESRLTIGAPQPIPTSVPSVAWLPTTPREEHSYMGVPIFCAVKVAADRFADAPLRVTLPAEWLPFAPVLEAELRHGDEVLGVAGPGIVPSEAHAFDVIAATACGAPTDDPVLPLTLALTIPGQAPVTIDVVADLSCHTAYGGGCITGEAGAFAALALIALRRRRS